MNLQVRRSIVERRVTWVFSTLQISKKNLSLKKRKVIWQQLYKVLVGREYPLSNLSKRHRRCSHLWIVLFNSKSSSRCQYDSDWISMKWILLCLYLATSLLKIRRMGWKLVLKGMYEGWGLLNKRAVEVSVMSTFFELWMNIFLVALHRNLSYRINRNSTTRIYTRFLSRIGSWRMTLSLCRRSWKWWWCYKYEGMFRSHYYIYQ